MGTYGSAVTSMLQSDEMQKLNEKTLGKERKLQGRQASCHLSTPRNNGSGRVKGLRQPTVCYEPSIKSHSPPHILRSG